MSERMHDFHAASQVEDTETNPLIAEDVLVQNTPESNASDTRILSSYEVAMRRFGLDPNVSPADPSTPRSVETASEVVSQQAPEEISQTNTPEVIEPTQEGAEIAPPLPAEAISQHEGAVDIMRSYKERFGIDKEDLEQIEGFTDLSRGQQRQVLENLAQITIGRIREEAIDGQSEEFSLKQQDANFLGKVWNGMKNSFTKKFEVVEREKKLAAEIEHGGIEEHKESLTQMVKGMKELGPTVKENSETGALEVQFIETDGMSPELSQIAEAFNKNGTEFSKIPYEWSLEGASREEQERFKAAKENYESQRARVMEQMAAIGGAEMATKAMAHTESVIEMQRFIQTCPDASKELENIQDQNAWTQALKSVGTERGAYMALGAVARSAVGAMAGFVAAPAAAALTGSIRGWRKAGDDLLERDRAARSGTVDESREAANMIAAARGESENALGYRGSTEKIDALVNKLSSESDDAGARAKLVTSLRQRIDYTKQKISEGKMVFGGDGERLTHQYALMKSLAEAEASIAGETFADERGERLEERLARMLGKTDAEIAGARNNYKFKQAVKAGLTSAAFAGLGATAADTVKWMNGASGTLAEKAFGDAASVKAEITGAVTAAKDEVMTFGDRIVTEVVPPAAAGQNPELVSGQILQNEASPHAHLRVGGKEEVLHGNAATQAGVKSAPASAGSTIPAPKVGTKTIEQYQAGAAAGERGVDIKAFSPEQAERYAPAIAAIKAEHGGVFPSNISQDELVRRQLAIESSPTPQAVQPSIKNETIKPSTVVSPKVGVKTLEQYQSGAAAGERGVDIKAFSPDQTERYAKAIAAIKKEHGGVFPSNITQDELVRRQLSLE